MKTCVTVFISFVVVSCLLASSTNPVFAANSVISVSPVNGSYNASFKADVVIDGHGDIFNAAQATITVSSNLAISNLVLDDCNFSFITTPTITNPSFAGVILGSSSKKCTLYTLTLVPKAKGKAAIAVSQASVKRFKDAANVLSSVQNGSYLLTGAANPAELAAIPQSPASQNNLYSALLKIQTDTNIPVTNTPVMLKTGSTQTTMKAVTNADGEAHFANLQPGIYTAVVQGYPGETILNLSGKNHAVVLGISVKQPNFLLKNAALLIGGALLLGIVLGGGVFAFFYWLKVSKASHKR